MITSAAVEKPEGAPVAQEIVIEAGKTELHYWRDLWRYRELFYFLAWRDILVRYKQTAIGIAWAVLQPLITTVIYTIIFHFFAKIKSENGVPYLLMVLAAMLPWNFYSRALSEASTSLINNTNLISKIYFPRLIIPAASVITALVDLLISAVLLVVIMLIYCLIPSLHFHYVPSWRILTLPLFLAATLGGAMGVGLWFAALNVSYRDFRYIVPFILMIGTYISPVGFPSDPTVPAQWRLLYSCNPMVGMIDGFRWAIFGGDAPLYLPGVAISLVVFALMLAGGVLYFRSTEKRFADVI